MKKYLILFGAMLLAMSGMSDTWTDPKTGIKWTYIISGGKASVGGGDWDPTAIPTSTTGAIVIPSTLGECPVTSIGDEAFGWCSGLTSVAIPDGVTNIGRGAFRGCYDLTSVTIPSSVTSIGPSAFSYCSGLTSVTIPEGVTSIGNSLFLGCNELASVTLPSTLSAVGGNPFRGCTNCVFGFSRPNALFSVKEGCLLSADGSYMYVGAVSNHVAIIPSCVSTIGTNAYAEAVHLREVRVPSHVRRICFAAFYETGLRSVEIEDGVEMIEENAFYFSPELTSIRLPNTISYLPGYMFWDTPIGTLEIPASVTNVSENVFYHMTNLVTIVFLGDAPNVRFGRQLEFLGVPQSAEIRVRKGSLGWDHDGLSAELPASGLWPYPSGGRRIIWYGDDPWKTGWWDEVSYEAVTDPAGGWFMTNGVCRTAELPSGAATNSIIFTVSGDGVFTFDAKLVGASDYDRLVVFVDGVLIEEVSCGELWRHRSCKTIGCGDHIVRLDFKISSMRQYGKPIKWSAVQNVRFVPAEDRSNDGIKGGPYCVIDISAGSTAAKFPVKYLRSIPDGGWTDNYKSDRIVLRRIEAGSFVMGDKQNQSHLVTLSDAYYIGVFEITQHQWELVMGKNPAWFEHDATRPVEMVTYDMIRGGSSGTQWPQSADVDSDSFLGRLRIRTNLDFDLPTEAQWEYACRAGTTTKFYWGQVMDGDYAWYSGNSEWRTHAVGSKKPNAWGLYDMAGNVWEWCLDWSGNLQYGNDPKGVSSASTRVLRGGGWDNFDGCCASYWRNDNSPSGTLSNFGLRIVVKIKDDPIPDIGETPTDLQLADALAGSADARLAECITNVASYNAYRDWAENVKTADGTEKAGSQAVKDSPNAWLSFAIGSSSLISELPTSDDVKVDSFVPASEAGKFDFTVSVDGINVSRDALKENLKRVFGLEGGATLQDMSADKVDIAFGTPEDGKVKFTAGPKDSSQKTFFMKVKMRK